MTSFLNRLADRAATRLLRLPPATGDYTVERDVAVPMRDGVTLAADLYRPRMSAKCTLLMRGPYGRSMPQARIFAARGHTVLFVSSRGTFGSGGAFDPMRDEAADGADVVAWMIAQPWFTGSFATLGLSYLGFTQWALLADPPPSLVAAVIVVGPHDFARHTWGTGALNLDLLGWSDMIAHQEEKPRVRAMVRQITAARRHRPVLNALPVADAGDALLAGRAPWYRERVTRPDITEEYWAPTRQSAALERTDVPVLLVGGWQDLFLSQTLEQYVRLHERGVGVALTVGPWTHLQTATRAVGLITRETFEFLDGKRPSPVRIHVAGVGWRELTSWPPPTVERDWFPEPDGFLAPGLAPVGAPPVTFTFDPADPTPTVGGPLLAGPGVVDDSSLAARKDVLVFTSAPLTRDLEVIGAPVAEIAHHSDNPHADLFVRLSEVDGDGRSHNVTEGLVRLDPHRTAGTVTLPLRATAHRFAAGQRIRLSIAGGSHPQYARNLGTDENPGTGTTLRPAVHEIDLGERTCLRLPVTSDPA